MPQNIHVFETRNVNYLKPYVDKAQSLGFNITVTNNAHLENNRHFNEFISAYKHYGVNTPEFEIACFARYFAIASLLKDDDDFFLTDTDVYITRSFGNLRSHDFKGAFVGSEGFDSAGSQQQISPHCTVWNRALLTDFINFTINAYKQNAEDNFLGSIYESQVAKYTHTAISDMNLIYLWIHANKVPYINSNSAAFEFGIDHNISALTCENGEFESFADRKYIKKRGDRCTCFLKSGEEIDMSLLHFQGAYKGTLKNFYLGRYTKFISFALRQKYKRKHKLFGSKST